MPYAIRLGATDKVILLYECASSTFPEKVEGVIRRVIAVTIFDPIKRRIVMGGHSDLASKKFTIPMEALEDEDVWIKK